MEVGRSVAGAGRPSDTVIPGGRVKGRKNGRKVNILKKKFFFFVQQILKY